MLMFMLIMTLISLSISIIIIYLSGHRVHYGIKAGIPNAPFTVFHIMFCDREEFVSRLCMNGRMEWWIEKWMDQ